MDFKPFFFLACVVPSALSYPLNHTEPTETFVPNPTGRGTIGLLYTCVLTLALCIWTALHPDVGFYKDNWFYGPAYKAMWMFLAIVLPEFVVCCAVSQFVQAKDLRRAWESHWQDKEDEDKEKWLGISGAFLVVMGGYEIRCPTTCHGNSPDCPMAGFAGTALVDKSFPPRPVERATTAGSTASEEKSLIQKQQLPRDVRRTLTPAGLKRLLEPTEDGLSLMSKLIQEGVLNHTHFDPCRIEDKGKANYVAKLLTTAQILWMVVQWIGRTAQGLPVTLLEVHILTKIPFTLVSYFCWWDKPLDLKIPISLPIGHRLQGAEWTPGGPGFSTHDSNPLRHEQLFRERRIAKSLFAAIFRGSYDFAWDFGYQSLAWCTAMFTLNGGLHATAWLAHFPTEVESRLWRAACLGVAISPLIITTLIWKRECECFLLQLAYRFSTRDISSTSQCANEFALLWRITAGSAEGENSFSGAGVMRPPQGFPRAWPLWCRHFAVAVVFVLVWIYMLCNLFFMIEAFISLRNVEASAYRTVEWADYLPHF
ncbi:uncharacterized protein B0H64DRAFT_201367 [Chaetomium fimeti]|uniref:Wax synthase domain-containing protein n=1 Tax=Chaetomium fimeti TaxID=1854472 RepID=A0AAE0HEP5_9PEZI|nr:hypothetical protein B0H64DRAFT_201367 [Chaetomium fimeti]